MLQRAQCKRGRFRIEPPDGGLEIRVPAGAAGNKELTTCRFLLQYRGCSWIPNRTHPFSFQLILKKGDWHRDCSKMGKR
jgi:hypothetical protein